MKMSIKMQPDYDVVLSKKLENTIGIHIKDGKFKNVFFSITSLKEDVLNDEAVVEFYIINKPKELTDSDFSSKEFQNLFNDIIQDLLKETEIDSTRD